MSAWCGLSALAIRGLADSCGTDAFSEVLDININGPSIENHPHTARREPISKSETHGCILTELVRFSRLDLDFASHTGATKKPGIRTGASGVAIADRNLSVAARTMTAYYQFTVITDAENPFISLKFLGKKVYIAKR